MSMDNNELAQAIDYTFTQCQLDYIGMERASQTEPGRAMLDHLRELLLIQRMRARAKDGTAQ